TILRDSRGQWCGRRITVHRGRARVEGRRADVGLAAPWGAVTGGAVADPGGRGDPASTRRLDRSAHRDMGTGGVQETAVSDGAVSAWLRECGTPLRTTLGQRLASRYQM